MNQDMDAKKLRIVLNEVFERRATAERVQPAWIATEAMKKLDRKRRSPALVHLGCHLQLRQMARELCREKFGKDAPAEPGEKEQHEMFAGLQRRYPAAHSDSDEPEYILLEYLDDNDIAYNVRRLRSEATAKLEHARKLEEYGQARMRIVAA